MNIQLAEAEQHFVRELAQQLGAEIREHLYSDMRDQSVWWSAAGPISSETRPFGRFPVALAAIIV